MARPTKQDAQLLLSLMDSFLSDSVREARKWWRTLPDGLSLEGFEKRFPRGSEGWEHFSTIVIFWETAGYRLGRGRIDQVLAFDTCMDAHRWRQLDGIIEECREY